MKRGQNLFFDDNPANMDVKFTWLVLVASILFLIWAWPITAKNYELSR